MSFDTQMLVNRAGAALVGAYTRAMLNIDVHWCAPLPSGRKIISPNHPTTTDPFFLLPIVPEPMRMLVTDAAFAVPVLGRLLRASGHIEVRHENGKLAFEAARAALEQGATIGLFPEGALSPANGLHPARTGAVRLALLTGAPIIPVGIHVDAEKVRMHKLQLAGRTEQARWYPSGRYEVTVGNAVYLRGDAEDRALVRACSAALMRTIAQLERESASRMIARATRTVFTARNLNATVR